MERLKILIAEDSKVCQEFYKLGISEKDFDRKFAGNGAAALEIYNSLWVPDIIVLDIMMPIKSGYTVLKEIREKEKNTDKTTVIIMASAISGKQDILDCVKLGIQGYLIKPVKLKEISNTILDIYNKFKSSQK